VWQKGNTPPQFLSAFLCFIYFVGWMLGIPCLGIYRYQDSKEKMDMKLIIQIALLDSKEQNDFQ
jgi:hypothetical protein